METNTIPLGIDAGNGAFKIFGQPGGLQVLSQVATDNGQRMVNTLGLHKQKPPLQVVNGHGAFYVGAEAHDYGRPVENLDVDRFNGTPEMAALLHGSLTRYQEKYGLFDAPLAVVTGLPNELLAGEEAPKNIENVKRWIKGTHTWQALGHARELGESVLLFLDEFTRYHMRAQESLMRLLLPIGPEVVRSLGIDYDGAVRATSAPFWGDEWAPANDVHIALACNPWGTPLDPALVRRTVPIMVGFSDAVANLFDLKLATAIRLSWVGTQDGTLPLPLEYGELVRATGPNDARILDRYRLRLTVLDPAASTAFDALLKGSGVV